MAKRVGLAGARRRLGQVGERGQPLDTARPQHQAGLVVRPVRARVWLEAVRRAEVLALDALLVEVELVAFGAKEEGKLNQKSFRLSILSRPGQHALSQMHFRLSILITTHDICFELTHFRA